MLAITTTLVTTIFTAAQATTTSWAAPFASSKPQSFQLFVPLPPLTTATAVVIVIAVTKWPATTVAPGAVAVLPRPPAISFDQVASVAFQALSFAFQGPFSSAPIRAGEELLLHLACHLPLLLR